MIGGEKSANNWSVLYGELIKLHRDLDAKRKLPGAKVYEFRLFDLVMDNDAPSKSPFSNMSFPDFLTMAFDLVDALRGKNHKDNSNVKFLSPRFAPLMPDKVAANRRHLSPSILAFYNDESQDTIASLPKVIIRVLQVTKRLDELFRSLEKSFNKIQNQEIAQKGFTFLDVKQIENILREHGVKDAKEVEFDVEEYGRLSRRQREEALWKRFELIAKNISSVHKRIKRTLPVSVLSPVVLAPYTFSPVVGLTVLGPVVLSPNIFSPLILNPSVLGPFVLSPAVAMPFILSPYLLSPYVLSPIVMAPFILNPYVLSPNVINPYILSPLILSPYVLCPDVISPQALGGQILSPSVLSPSFLTESVLMASVLSPTFLS
uniref:Uncharacterized protein n=1 Tax=Parascaris equorum TaxID=6256 RepID=A0A914RUC3_PAREQ